MITVRGKVEEGKILALEPVDESLEGREVRIVFDDNPNEVLNGEAGDLSGAKIRTGWDRLRKFLDENQIDTGITDMAHQHDHYLYGTPKRED